MSGDTVARRPYAVQCAGKGRFATWAQAARRVRIWRLHKRHEYADEGAVAQPYRCPHCGSYHIGNLRRGQSGNVVAYRRKRQQFDYEED